MAKYSKKEWEEIIVKSKEKRKRDIGLSLQRIRWRWWLADEKEELND